MAGWVPWPNPCSESNPLSRPNPLRLLTHPGLLVTLYAAVRVGAPLAVVFGLMYESWIPVLIWAGLGCGGEALLWFDRTHGLRPRRGKVRRR